MWPVENIRAFIPWIQATLKTYFQNRPPIGRRGLRILFEKDLKFGTAMNVKGGSWNCKTIKIYDKVAFNVTIIAITVPSSRNIE